MSLPRPLLPARVTGRLAVRLTVTAALAAAILLPAAAEAARWPGHPDRSIVHHAVRAGETATGLAVRYHAWTAELLRLNHLGSQGHLRRGQVLRIPVVLSAAHRAHAKTVHHTRRHTKKHTGRHTTKHRHRHRAHHHHHLPPLIHRTTPSTTKWLHAGMSRTQVRTLVVRMARRYHVPPRLALAIAWQESGWQQLRVSSTGALGV
ncbi:MAG: LysM peptidoglycan-binding domain-containing protein, partial [Marmoricola sp.]